jgi:hypothetical protein
LIQSLLATGEDFNQPVKPFHKSFPDFITDPSRCADTRFYISPQHLHFELATNCLRVMNDGLEQDLLSLPEYALNSEVEDLQSRIDGRVSIALQYACRSWHNHLTETRGDVTDILSHLRVFLEEKFLAWLEVLSVLKDVGERLLHWKGWCPGCRRFVLVFSIVSSNANIARTRLPRTTSFWTPPETVSIS